MVKIFKITPILFRRNKGGIASCILAFFLGFMLLGGHYCPSASASNTGNFPDKVFAPYVDAVAWPSFSLRDTYSRTGQQFYTLAFVISGGECKPAWGGTIPLSDNWYMDDINFIRGAGGDVIVSFGGANGTELAQSCTDTARLQAAYQSVIDKYDLKWVDFDIEGAAVADPPSIDRRNKAIKGLQAANPDLKIAFCLPAAPQGLTADGLNVLKNAKSNGVRIDVVNVMTMDYGDGIAPAPEGKMGTYAIDAANNTHTQLLNLGIDTHIGITPMIGQNDVPTERFYLSDAQQLTGWAADINQQNWVSLLAMWSVNRDNGGCPGKAAQGVCSGISQDEFAFTKTFSNFSRNGNGNILPAVKITSPSDRTHFEAGANIVITAEAGDTDGTIAQVEFFQGTASLGIAAQAPYSITWKNVKTGSYVLTAAATDDRNGTGRSLPVQIFAGNVCTARPWESPLIYLAGDSVSFNGHEWKAQWWTQGEKPGTTGEWGVWRDQGSCGGNSSPTVAITAPLSGSSYPEASAIIITAEAGDTDGTIAQVEFFQGTVSLGAVKQAPYSITIRNAGIGTYVYTAAATDNNGAAAISSPVRITVGNNNGGSCSSYSAWNPNQDWTTYRVGDKKTNAGKLWECRNIAYSYWEPSGPYGHFGWTNVGECN